MDTQNLKAFTCIARLGSFSAAAEALHLTQPAVSKRMHNLEDQAGARLIDRIGRNIMLTEAGQCLLPQAQKILQLMDEARQSMDDLTGPVRGTLKLATSHHIGLHRLPAVLRSYRRSWPEVKLNIRFLNSRESHEAVLTGEAELGITTEENLASDQLLADRIWTDQLQFVVAGSHPLCKVAKPTLADLADFPALLPDARFTTGRIVRDLFSRHQLKLTVDEDLSTDYLETLKAMVGISDSWSVLPHTMLTDNTLAVVKPSGLTLTRNLNCIRHRNRTLSRAGKAFFDMLQSIR